MSTIPPFQLTLSAVKRGYAESGLKPCTGGFLRPGSCCPLTAAAIAYYGRIPTASEVCYVFSPEIGLTNSQRDAYWCGVDENGPPPVTDPFYYNLGREHAKALGL